MLKIAFFNNETLIKELNFPNEYIYNIAFGNGNVKEIAFNYVLDGVSDLNEQKTYFEQANDEMRTIDLDSITDTYVYFTEDQYYHFHSPVKQTFYKVGGYSNSGNYELKDNFTIRFLEQISSDWDEDNCYCSNKCFFYEKDKGYCSHYRLKLNFCETNHRHIVCQNCFLENDHKTLKNLKLELYGQLQKKKINLKSDDSSEKK